MNHDRLTNAASAEVAQGAMLVVDTLQRLPSELQPLSLGVAFRFLLDHLRLQPQDVMTLVGNMLEGPDRKRTAEMRAVEMYVQQEISR